MDSNTSRAPSFKKQFFLQTLIIGGIVVAITVFFYITTINEKEKVFEEFLEKIQGKKIINIKWKLNQKCLF